MMRAITLHQPWADLMAHGFKKIETRSHRTKYYGELMIHAGKSDTHQVSVELGEWCIKSGLQFPRGVILAVCELYDCLPTEQLAPDAQEKLFGNFQPPPLRLADAQRAAALRARRVPRTSGDALDRSM